MHFSPDFGSRLYLQNPLKDINETGGMCIFLRQHIESMFQLHELKVKVTTEGETFQPWILGHVHTFVSHENIFTRFQNGLFMIILICV